MSNSAVIKGFSIIRLELDGLIIILDSVVVPVLVLIGEATIEESSRVVRVYLDRLMKVFDGAVVLAYRGMGTAAVVEIGEIRVKLDGLIEIHDGAVVLAL